MKRSTHSSHENAASLGTADDIASRRDNAEHDEADLTGSAEIDEDTGSAKIGLLARAQADEAGPALEATTVVSQASNSLISPSAKLLPAAAAVEKVPIRVVTAYVEGS